MIIPGVAEWPSLGRLLGDVIGWLINLRKQAQFIFPSNSQQKLMSQPTFTQILLSQRLGPYKSRFFDLNLVKESIYL